uniref:Uncharacterized protein n=1 Tax=Haemonchus contortus TaxID=6289 RepID=A0A7I4YDW6_HAECO|nr:unnamed protein product [Haemonchus contortus]
MSARRTASYWLNYIARSVAVPSPERPISNQGDEADVIRTDAQSMEHLHDPDGEVPIEYEPVSVNEDAQVGNESSSETSLKEPGDGSQDGAEARNAAEKNDPEGKHMILLEEQGNDDADDVEVRIEEEKIKPEEEQEILPREHGDIPERRARSPQRRAGCWSSTDPSST